MYYHPGNRVDYGRQGVGWIQRNRNQPEMLHNPTYETRVGHTMPYGGYSYVATYSGLVVYDVVSARPRWMVSGAAHTRHIQPGKQAQRPSTAGFLRAKLLPSQLCGALLQRGRMVPLARFVTSSTHRAS
jgi:hypothetical protein